MYSKLYVCSFFVLTFVCRKEKLPYLISMDSIRMRSICKAENQRLIHDHTRCDLLLLLLLLKMIAIHWTYPYLIVIWYFFVLRKTINYKGRAISILGEMKSKRKKRTKMFTQNTCLMQLDSIGPCSHGRSKKQQQRRPDFLGRLPMLELSHMHFSWRS